MQISDTIADMLTRIRNASAAKHDSVDVPASNVKKAIAQILLDEGYITSFQVEEDGKQGVIHITFKYGQKKNFKARSAYLHKRRGNAQGYEGPRHCHPFHLKGNNDRQAGSQSQCWRRSSRLCLVRRCFGNVKNRKEAYHDSCRCRC